MSLLRWIKGRRRPRELASGAVSGSAGLDWLITDRTIALHRDAKGKPMRMAISKGIVGLIRDHVGAGDLTIETGAGLSTVAFIAAGAKHTAIAPDAALGERIVDFCGQRGLRGDNLTFYADYSQERLPSLSGPYRFALIDGSHSFPEVFVDYFYLNPLIDVGGILVVDDVWVWTGEVLAKFLAAEDEWDVVFQDFKSAAFRKIRKTSKYKHFEKQKFVMQNSYKLKL